MKTILRIFLFITVIFSSLVAQSTENLKVRLDQNENNTKPVILNLQVQTGEAISGAVFIEVPAGLKPVLHSAKLNDRALWLLNSKEEITRDNVIGWYAQENGLILHYNDSITKNSELLEIELVPDSYRLERFDKVGVSIYPVSNSGQELLVEKSVLAQSNVTVNKVEKE